MISQAASLEASDGKVKVKRQTEYGYDVIEATTAAVEGLDEKDPIEGAYRWRLRRSRLR